MSREPISEAGRYIGEATIVDAELDGVESAVGFLEAAGLQQEREVHTFCNSCSYHSARTYVILRGCRLAAVGPGRFAGLCAWTTFLVFAKGVDVFNGGGHIVRYIAQSPRISSPLHT